MIPKHFPKQVLTNAENLTGDTSRIVGNAKNIFGDASGLEGTVDYILGNVSGITGELISFGRIIKGNVSNISGNIGRIWGDASKILGKIHEKLKGDVSFLQGDVSKIYGSISTTVPDFFYSHQLLRGNVSSLEGDISKIYGDASRISGKIHENLSGDVSSLEGDITGLEGHYDMTVKPFIKTTVSNVDLFKIAKKEGLDFEDNTVYFDLNNPFHKQHYEKLSKIYDEEIFIKIKAKRDLHATSYPIYFAGYGVVYCKSKNSGAFTFRGVEKINGNIFSDGSTRYPSVHITKGSVFKIVVSKGVLKNLSDEDKELFEVIYLNDSASE